MWLRRLWPFGRRQAPLTREESLASVPVRNAAVVTRRTDAGEIEITIPRLEALWVRVLARVFYVPKARKLVLDELGTYVWERCDGSTTVKDLVAGFSERYKLGRREAEVSLTEYLKLLAKRGLIGIAVPRDPRRPIGGSSSTAGRETGTRRRRRARK